ncbi:MAG: hypothetical protein DLM55_09590 [Acidimicrobiales bacterium]|nr:MAG: hypothetical protein DLM55_09590 [Acidimicrobiales bacterium]
MDHPNRAPVGVFVGLAIFDSIYLLTEPIGPNQKQRALRYLTASGGPATNAAVTFSALGGIAKLVSAVGHGTLADAVTAELTELDV